MSIQAFSNLLTHQPRVTNDGDIVYSGFKAEDMFQEYGHKLRDWRDRDRKTKELIGPRRLVTVLGTEDANTIAKGFEAVEIKEGDGELKIKTAVEDKSRWATFGAYAVDGEGKPLLTPVMKDELFFYAKIITGLVHTPVRHVDPRSGKTYTKLWTEDDLTGLMRRRMNVSEHGFHTLGGADTIRNNVGESDLSDQTQVLWSKASRSKIFDTKIPQSRWQLVRIYRHGGEGAVQDTGVLVRYKGLGDTLQIIDASNDPVVREAWRIAEQARIDQHRANIKARALARKLAKQKGETVAEVVEADVDEVVPTTEEVSLEETAAA